MFNFEERTKFKTNRPYEEVRKKVRDALDEVGEAKVRDDGDIEIYSSSFKSFAYQIKVDGELRQRKEPGEYSLFVKGVLNPEVAGIVLGVIFIPVGLILLLTAMSAKNQVQTSLKNALDDLEDELDERS